MILRLRTLLLLLLAMGAFHTATAEIVVVSQSATANAGAASINFDVIQLDEENTSDNTLFNTFGANFTVASAGDAFPAVGAGTVANESDMTLSTSVQVTRSATEVLVIGSSNLAANSSRSPDLPLPIDVGGGGDAFMEIFLEIKDSPARVVFEMISQQATKTGSLSGPNNSASVGFEGSGGIVSQFLTCSNLPSGCVARPPYTITGIIAPGTHRFFISTSVLAGGVGTASASCSYSLRISESVCDLTWSDPAGGDFADAENWSPAQVPSDTGDGCMNLVLDTPGAYAITLPGDAAANSLTVAAGEPSLLGGDLSLGGVNFPDALSVLNEARLTVESGSLQSGSVLVSGVGAQPAFLRVKPGAVLRAFENLEVGRGIGEAGELVLGDGVEQSVFSMLGNVTLGGAGKSTVFGNGNLNFGVFGDLLMGVFDGSQSNLNLNGDAAQFRAVEFFVSGASIIGGQGSAALSLSGLNVGTMDSLRMGTLAGGEGTLNLSGADCQLDITKGVNVGEAGQADIIVFDGARFKAAELLLGTEAGGRGDLELTGEGSTIEVSGDASVGGEGSAGAVISNGGTLTAGFITVDSTSEDGALLSVDGSVAPAKVEASTGIIVAGSGDGVLAMNGDATVITPELALGVLAGSNMQSLWQGDLDADGVEDSAVSVQVENIAQIGLDGAANVLTLGASAHRFGSLLLGVNLNGNGIYQTSGAFGFTNVSGELLVGLQGKGTLEIAEGGFTAGACTLGSELGGLGVLRLSSGASLIVEAPPLPPANVGEVPFGFLQVGRLSNGLLELFDTGTRAQCAEAIVGGSNPAAGGTVNLDTGAQLECFGSMTLGAASGPALLRMANGAKLNIASSLIIGSNARVIIGGGALCAASSVSVEGRLEVEDEVIIERPEPPEPPVKIAANPTIIEGDLALAPSGVLSVKTSAGLRVTGAVTLAGTLEIVLTPGAVFTDEQLVDLIEFTGGVSGAFDTVTFINAPEGFEAGINIEDGLLRMEVSNGGTATGEGEGEGEGEPTPPSGCDGCRGDSAPIEKALGDVLSIVFGLALLMGAHLHFRKRLVLTH